MNRDWKLVTLSSGHRDLCQLSCKAENTQQDFVQNVKKALDILFTLPNIIIQVISPMGKGRWQKHPEGRGVDKFLIRLKPPFKWH